MTENNTQNMMEEDAEATAPSDSGLKQVSMLGARQINIEAEMADIAEQQANLAEQLKQITDVDLPAAMAEVGLKSFTLDSGETIEIEEGIGTSISKKNEAEAFAWLRDNGHGDIIKNVVSVSFGRGEEAEAQAAKDMLAEAGVTGINQKESVHWQTLRAFVKEQLQRGVNIPEDAFGIYEYQKSKIKR